MLDVLPGNAAEVMLGESATPESLAALSAKLGLDRPAPVRYADWMKGFVAGDLGTSNTYGTPIGELVAELIAQPRQLTWATCHTLMMPCDTLIKLRNPLTQFLDMGIGLV